MQFIIFLPKVSMAIQNMTEKTRLEINIRRLLGQCELLAKEDSKDSNLDWKLEMVNSCTTFSIIFFFRYFIFFLCLQYLESLQDMIEKLQTSPG